MPLYRRLEPSAQIPDEFKCAPLAEDALYGHLHRGAKPPEESSSRSGPGK